MAPSGPDMFDVTNESQANVRENILNYQSTSPVPVDGPVMEI